MATAWQRAGRLGGEAVHRLRDRLEALEAGNESDDATAFPALHWMTAALFLAAGAEAALLAQNERTPAGVGPRSARAALAELATTLRDPAVAAPLLAAPLAGAAHAARVLSPTPRARQISRLLDGVAAGVAVAGAARVAYNALARGEGGRTGAQPRPRPRLAGAVAPLTFGATALLGLILEREEERERRELQRLRLRASVVERLVPRRKPRLDRIVLHI